MATFAVLSSLFTNILIMPMPYDEVSYCSTLKYLVKAWVQTLCYYLHRVSSTMSVAFGSREVHIMHLKESFYFITEKLMSFIRHFRCNFIMSRVSTNPKWSSFKKALVELHALTCTISKPLCNLNSYTHYFKSFHLYIYNIPIGFVWVRIASHLMPILRCWFCRPRRNWRV